MLEIFACVVIIVALGSAFGYIIYLMWQFLKKATLAIEMDDALPENPSSEEKKKVLSAVEEALEYYDKLGYISRTSNGEMKAYKEYLDKIFDKVYAK